MIDPPKLPRKKYEWNMNPDYLRTFYEREDERRARLQRPSLASHPAVVNREPSRAVTRPRARRGIA